MKKDSQKNKKIDDISFISEDDVTEMGEKAIKVLRKKLKSCEKEKQEYLTGWQRAKADFVNARREEDGARKKILELAKEDVLLGILPVVDSFELAFANKKSWEKVDVSWRKGVEYIYSQLLKVFEENGLKQVIPLGEIFDPIFHDSVESIDVKNSSEGGKILEVLQNGYSMNNKVVRPARVKVAIYKKE